MTSQPKFIHFDLEGVDDLDEYLHFELRFAAEPNDEQLTELGRRWQRGFGVEADLWTMSGVFAQFEVPCDGGREERALQRVRAFILEVHELLPIVEACFGSLPGGHPDAIETPEAFERGCSEAGREKLAARAQAIAAETASTPIKLVPTPPPTKRGTDAYPPWATRWLAEDKAVIEGPLGGPVIRVEGSNRGNLPGAGAELTLPEGLSIGSRCRIAPRSERAVATLCVGASESPQVLSLIADGTARQLWRAKGEDAIVGAAWLDDEHVAFATYGRTVVLAVATGEEVASWKSGGFCLHVTAHGQLLVLSGNLFLVWSSGKLRAASKKLKWNELVVADWDDESIVLEVREQDVSGGFLRVDAKEALATKRATKSKAKKPQAKKPVLTSMPIEQLTPMLPTEASDAQKAQMEAAGHALAIQQGIRSYVVTTQRNGVAVAFTSEGMLFYSEAAGEVALVKIPKRNRASWLSGATVMSPEAFQLTADGKRAFAVLSAAGIVEGGVGESEARIVARLDRINGATKLGIWSGLAPDGSDRILILMEKGFVDLRRGDGKWEIAGSVKVSKPTGLFVDSDRRQVLVTSAAKARVLLFDLDSLKKVAAFEEDVAEVRVGPDGWELANSKQGEAYRIAQS